MTDHRLIAYGENANTQIYLDRFDYDTYTVSIHTEGAATTHDDFDSLTDAYIRFSKACRKNSIVPRMVKNA